jgi:hypothetical protein
VTDEKLHEFYEDLVRGLRDQGVLCGITSGLACVHFAVAETTKDCDLLCHESDFDTLLQILGDTVLDGHPCRYRGHLPPPLDARWHCGGWTSHFQWGNGPVAVTLDVFGRALRGSSRWEHELSGIYVSPHVVSEMKRTNRDKDWPFITSLGELLLESGDPRGWLHLYDLDALRRTLRNQRPPPELVERRPLLQLALRNDGLLEAALLAERQLWSQLDRIRIEVYRRALKPYNMAVIRACIPAEASLAEQHAVRLACAQASLRPTPIRDYGIERLIAEARAATEQNVRPEAMAWLPDLHPNFNYLAP